MGYKWRNSQAKLRNLCLFEKSNPLPSSKFRSFLLDSFEVKYFLLLGLDIPSSAMDVFEMSETFRRHTANLDLIVNMYNISTLPLLRNHLFEINWIHRQNSFEGIGDVMEQTKSLNWKSVALRFSSGKEWLKRKKWPKYWNYWRNLSQPRQ